MTPTRRKAEKKAKSEKSIGTPGALSSNNAPTPVPGGSSTPASGGSSAPVASGSPASAGASTPAPTAKPAPAKRPSVAKAAKVAPKPKPKLEAEDIPSPTSEGGEAADKKPSAVKRPSAARAKSKKLGVVFAVLAILAVLLTCAFSWYRWLYGNDALNMQGTWYVNGSDAAITITEDEIVLADDVTYTYTIDPVNKSIEFFFSDLSGCGHYRFSLDRGELAIIDGECTGTDSILSDLGWLMGALFFELQGKEAAPAEAEGAMLLSREPVAIVEEATDGTA